MRGIRIDQADKLFSEYIRTRDNWTCQRCGKQYTPPTQGLHCSHFMSRKHENTRFDPDNCDAMCYGCHAYFTANPLLHYEWQVKRKGQTVVDRLKMSAFIYKKKDREIEKIKWKHELAKLKNN